MKAVQTGEQVLAADASSATVAITPVAMDKAFLMFGTRFDAVEPSAMQVSGKLSDASHVTFQRVGAAGSPAVSIVWYVAEFQSGVLVQRGNAAMATTKVTVPLTTTVETLRTFPVISYRNSGAALGKGDFVRAKIAGPSALELNVGEAAANGIVEWQVVSFDGATVQAGDLPYPAGETAPVQTIPAVDTTRSWLAFSYDISSSTSDNLAQKMFRARFTNTTTMMFNRSGNGSAGTISWQAISFNNGTLAHPGSASFSGFGTQVSANVGAYAASRTIASGGGLYLHGGSTSYNNTMNAGVCSFTAKQASGAFDVWRQTSGTGASNCDISFWAIEFK